MPAITYHQHWHINHKTQFVITNQSISKRPFCYLGAQSPFFLNSLPSNNKNISLYRRSIERTTHYLPSSDPGRLNLSLLCFLFLHHQLPTLQIEKAGVECHGSEDPDIQTIEQGKIVNEAWSLEDVGWLNTWLVVEDVEKVVSDGEVKAFRVDVGNAHQTGQDNQDGNSQDYFPAHITFHVLSSMYFLVCLYLDRCQPVVSQSTQSESTLYLNES